ncbi:MAG: NAD-dependent epimerase/dehydratase family protein [Gammaproteobacteria bacterium]|nr:NAD-dependent epimerase/dehydratase family protein [Gammaproteobacteria bacterium]
MSRVLVTGAFGQIGSELSLALAERHGGDALLLCGRRLPRATHACADLPACQLDVTDREALRALVTSHRTEVVYHLAARLSAIGEQSPEQTWTVNIDGLRNVLSVALECGVRQVFWPSSIAVFGPDTPRTDVPQDTVMRPTTMYGVTKVAGELLADYYHGRHGLDVRGVRYPGVISSAAPPGGGTTDYAVEMFHAALSEQPYSCFVREDTVLPMIYMPDCIRAALELMAADPARLRHRNAFNLAAMSFSAGELAAEIRRHVPGFVCRFEPDQRQRIADSWPRSIDDRDARREWGWQPRFGLAEMVRSMLDALRARRNQTGSAARS